MLGAEEMLARIEADLVRAQNELEFIKRDDNPDRYKVYHIHNLSIYLENLFGNFKYGPRITEGECSKK